MIFVYKFTLERRPYVEFPMITDDTVITVVLVTVYNFADFNDLWFNIRYLLLISIRQ